MRKILIIALLLKIISVPESISQVYPRMENPNYMYTRLFDDFNSTSGLNTTIWTPSSHALRGGLFIWVDSIATIRQSNGNLNLSMLGFKDYTTTQYNYDYNRYDIIKANFIAGEVQTNEYFNYGIYECHATFSNKYGSFPAFWTMGGPDCKTSFNNEIDIVELKHNHPDPTLDNNIFYYPQPCGKPQSKLPNDPIENSFSWVGEHTFKCVWTPTRIEFWVDVTKLYEIQNTGQYWYPILPQRVILSQQIINYNDKSPNYGIAVPQTSNFHWVKVREFFLAPEITVPTYVCSIGTATLDVSSLAYNITWQLTPSSLFVTSSGTGKTANIVRAAGAVGTGNIQYTFQMPGGEAFTANKDILIGAPPIPVIAGSLSPRCGYTYPYSVTNILATDNATYYWESDILEISNPTSKVCTAWPTIDGEGTITCTVTACGVSRTESRIVLAKLCYEYEVELFPNPSSDIMEVSLTKKISEDGTEIQEDDGAIEYVDPVFNVRVASQMGTVVYTAKTTNKKFSIPVSNFQNGNYYLEINDHKNSYRKQFIVKH